MLLAGRGAHAAARRRQRRLAAACALRHRAHAGQLLSAPWTSPLHTPLENPRAHSGPPRCLKPPTRCYLPPQERLAAVHAQAVLRVPGPDNADMGAAAEAEGARAEAAALRARGEAAERALQAKEREVRSFMVSSNVQPEGYAACGECSACPIADGCRPLAPLLRWRSTRRSFAARASSSARSPPRRPVPAPSRQGRAGLRLPFLPNASLHHTRREHTKPGRTRLAGGGAGKRGGGGAAARGAG
jgi:hypothetical protein